MQLHHRFSGKAPEHWLALCVYMKVLQVQEAIETVEPFGHTNHTNENSMFSFVWLTSSHTLRSGSVLMQGIELHTHLDSGPDEL